MTEGSSRDYSFIFELINIINDILILLISARKFIECTYDSHHLHKPVDQFLNKPTLDNCNVLLL